MNADQISFVFQGPISNLEAAAYLGESIAAIRRTCPGAEIVVATWKGAALDGVHADQLLQLDDPGALATTPLWWNRFRFRNQNTKRMLISSLEGLRAGGREFAVKLRTDARVNGESIRREMAGLSALEPEAAIFSRRVAVGCLFSRNPRRSALLFHLSDILLAGERTDLLSLFERACRWVGELESNSETPIPWLCPEQFLWFPTLRGTSGVSLAHGFAYGVRKVLVYDRAAAANVKILESAAVGLEFSKQFGTSVQDCYSPAELVRYEQDARVRPIRYALHLGLSSLASNAWARVSLLMLGVKTRLPLSLGVQR